MQIHRLSTINYQLQTRARRDKFYKGKEGRGKFGQYFGVSFDEKLQKFQSAKLGAFEGVWGEQIENDSNEIGGNRFL